MSSQAEIDLAVMDNRMDELMYAVRAWVGDRMPKDFGERLLLATYFKLFPEEMHTQERCDCECMECGADCGCGEKCDECATEAQTLRWMDDVFREAQEREVARRGWKESE